MNMPSAFYDVEVYKGGNIHGDRAYLNIGYADLSVG